MERYTVRGLEDRQQEMYSAAEDVWLRSFAPEDADRVVRLIQSNPEHFKSVGEGDTVEKYLTPEDFLNSLNQPKANRVRFGIWSNNTPSRELVGSINYELRDDGYVEIGYWVGAEHAGHAYAQRALRTLVRYLLQSGHQDLRTDVRVDNGASRKTVESSGFEALRVNEFNYVEYQFRIPEESTV